MNKIEKINYRREDSNDITDREAQRFWELFAEAGIELTNFEVLEKEKYKSLITLQQDIALIFLDAERYLQNGFSREKRQNQETHVYQIQSDIENRIITSDRLSGDLLKRAANRYTEKISGAAKPYLNNW